MHSGDSEIRMRIRMRGACIMNIVNLADRAGIERARMASAAGPGWALANALLFRFKQLTNLLGGLLRSDRF